MSNSSFLMNGHWCRALATLLVSGLDAQQALTSLQVQAQISNAALAKACAYALIQIQQGKSLIDTFAQYHFFNRYQIEQLRVAELSGKLPSTLCFLANRIEKHQTRTQKLTAQLKFSYVIIVIALVANTALAVLAHISFVPQLFNLLTIVLITKLLYRVLAIDILKLLAGAWRFHLIQHIQVLKQLFEYYWYSLWLLQYQAGIDQAQIASNLVNLLPAPIYRNHCRICQRHLEEGTTLVYALSQAQLLLTTPLKQTVMVGEKSGELASHMKHYLLLEEQRLEIVTTAFYEWLPRIYYLLVLAVVLDVFV